MVTHGIIVNILFQHIIPTYKFDRSLTAGSYIPRCCDNIIVRYDKNCTDNPWTLISAPPEMMDGIEYNKI